MDSELQSPRAGTLALSPPPLYPELVGASLRLSGADEVELELEESVLAVSEPEDAAPVVFQRGPAGNILKSLLASGSGKRSSFDLAAKISQKILPGVSLLFHRISKTHAHFVFIQLEQQTSYDRGMHTLCLASWVVAASMLWTP